MRALLWSFCAWCICSAALEARTWIVAPSGGDFTRIQDALDAAQAGDVILVRDNPAAYHEKLVFPRNGDAVAGPIILMADPGHHPVLDGTGVTGQHMMLLQNRSHITIEGFEIRNNSGVTDGGGIRVTGAGAGIAIRGNVIHDMRGRNAMGITVYGTSTTASIASLVVEGNEIYDCEPAPSEALTLNGNVEGFAVTGNHVHDVNNIGIDLIGGEADINPLLGARNGVVRGNQVERARSNYGGGYGAGLYVDGGRDLLLEGNIIRECDLGIEVGAENNGWNTTGVTVRSNLITRNDKAGLVFGGYDSSVGRVRLCEFVNNTCYQNDTTGQFLGELWIQWASDNVVRNNVFHSTNQNTLLYSENGNVNNTLDYNLYFSPGGASGSEWVWRNHSYGSFGGYKNGSGQDAHSLFADPRFVNAAGGDFGLRADSPAIDAADPADMEDALDLAGFPRWLDGNLDGALRSDIGAREFSHATLALSGSFTPGGAITLDVAGTAGLAATVYAGYPCSTLLPSYGYLGLDFARSHRAIPCGPIPAMRTVIVPLRVLPGTLLAVQAAAAAGAAGSLSNPVALTIE